MTRAVRDVDVRGRQAEPVHLERVVRIAIVEAPQLGDDARRDDRKISDGGVGFDLGALGQISGRSGLDLGEVLTAPAVPPAWRGDLNRPLIPA